MLYIEIYLCIFKCKYVCNIHLITYTYLPSYDVVRAPVKTVPMIPSEAVMSSKQSRS